MKCLKTTAVILSLISLGLMGCNEQSESSIKKETTIETPAGTTTITTEKEVKETPDNPATKTP